MSDSINPIRLDIEDIQVTTYATSDRTIISPIDDGGYCCTGCDSGCGINPTASYCESGGASSVPNCQ
ncbi:hypothetical protein [Longimicrobium sp.]|uniref:hypothetical protein n=1 Tax=Longimicrobium sp. TaxID=2029185 RepID=UPI002E36C07C|nr:hypothetical protein [Longimicrobium sp.]HEX6038853.1 hypothetical protein [Longimicrobium sp.]